MHADNVAVPVPVVAEGQDEGVAIAGLLCSFSPQPLQLFVLIVEEGREGGQGSLAVIPALEVDREQLQSPVPAELREMAPALTC